MTDLRGKVFDRKYRVVRLLGEGGMGTVYEAEHTFIHRRVALKVLHPEFTSNQEVVSRFFREAQAASAIGHPNIIEMHDVGLEEDGSVFTVMELLIGKGLQEVILEHGKLEFEAAAIIALQVLSALVVAHKKGIIHRDLKPDNVFLAVDSRGREEVKLLDFGIAKVLGADENTQLTKAGTILGTPSYMSPEQARGKQVDHRADLWAVGVMIYEMLSGVLPFEGESYNEVIGEILMEQAPSLRDTGVALPEGLILVVEKALAKDVNDRFEKALEMIDALMPFVEGSSGEMTTSVFEALSKSITPPPFEPDSDGEIATETGLLKLLKKDSGSLRIPSTTERIGPSEDVSHIDVDVPKQKTNVTQNLGLEDISVIETTEDSQRGSSVSALKALETRVEEGGSARRKHRQKVLLALAVSVVILGIASMVFVRTDGQGTISDQVTGMGEGVVTYWDEKADTVIENGNAIAGVKALSNGKGLPVSGDIGSKDDKDSRTNVAVSVQEINVRRKSRLPAKVTVRLRGLPKNAKVFFKGRQVKPPLVLPRSSRSVYVGVKVPRQKMKEYTIIPRRDQVLNVQRRKEITRKQPKRRRSTK